MKNQTYPPGPKSVVPGAPYFALHRNPLGFLTSVAREYGDIVHLALGPRHDYLVSHPDFIKEILSAEGRMLRSTPRALKELMGNGLLTSQGETHRRQRRFLMPAFHRQRIAAFAPVMTEQAERVSAQWAAAETIDVMEEMNRLTLSVVLKTLLGTDLGAEEEKIAEACDVMKEMTGKESIPFIDTLLSKLPLPRNFRLRCAIKNLDDAIYQLIAKRRSEKGSGRADLMSLLLETQKTEDGMESLSDKEVRDQLMTMLTAGHETIATALTWTWYLLSKNPDAETKLHKELESVLGGRPPVAEDLPRLTYTRMVFTESMRLYPPVWLIVRHPMEDYKIGGYTIPAGSYIHMSQYLVHRDPRFFENPESFDPERWTPEASDARLKCAYFPFGAGARQCIGEGFAWNEGMLIIATIAQRWKLRLARLEPIGLEPLITLRPKGGMQMKLELRKAAVLDARAV